MKKKIIGIVVLMLLATTVVSATNLNIKKDIKTTPPKGVLPYVPGLNWGVDQKQTWHDGYGINLMTHQSFAQSFTPTKDKLTAVSMVMFKYGNPSEPVFITVSIRDNLTSSDIVTITRNTSVNPIANVTQWILFDFEDISITPNSKYYIIVSANTGGEYDSYCWAFSSVNDRYTRGEAWFKENESANWTTDFGFDILDFCFKTYFRKPLAKSVTINNENPIGNWVLFMLRRFPNAFPILKQLIGL